MELTDIDAENKESTLSGKITPNKIQEINGEELLKLIKILKNYNRVAVVLTMMDGIPRTVLNLTKDTMSTYTDIKRNTTVSTIQSLIFDEFLRKGKKTGYIYSNFLTYPKGVFNEDSLQMVEMFRHKKNNEYYSVAMKAYLNENLNMKESEFEIIISPLIDKGYIIRIQRPDVAHDIFRLNTFKVKLL
jgi:hypothetical protein